MYIFLWFSRISDGEAISPDDVLPLGKGSFMLRWFLRRGSALASPTGGGVSPKGLTEGVTLVRGTAFPSPPQSKIKDFCQLPQRGRQGVLRETIIYIRDRRECIVTQEKTVKPGKPADLESWMALVRDVRGNFPGLETEEALEEHRQTVLRFMEKEQALCVKRGDMVVGVLLFSKKHNMICCLAVAPETRRQGIGSALLE